MIEPKVLVDRLRTAFGGPDHHRTLHAKGRFYAGTFTATPEAAAIGRALHLNGEPVPVVVRWSNAGGNVDVPDKKPDIRGMAVKFQLPDGTSTDLLGQTSPRFPTDDPAEFVAMTEASLNRLTFPFFLLRHPRMAGPIIAGIKAKAAVSHHSFAEPAYYPIHAYGWLDADGKRTWVRYVFKPTATKADRLPETFDGPDRLPEEMAARLQRGPVTFEVWLQVAGEGHDPHSSVSVWKDAREVLAGRIVVTDELLDQDPLFFDPARVVDGIELSGDPILRYRPVAYGESIGRRT